MFQGKWIDTIQRESGPRSLHGVCATFLIGIDLNNKGRKKIMKRRVCVLKKWQQKPAMHALQKKIFIINIFIILFLIGFFKLNT